MFEKFVFRFAESISLRLLMIGAIVMSLTGITTSWEGASYLSLLIGAPFLKTFVSLLIFGLPGSLIIGFVVLYPIERWVIRDKASKSWKWVVIRFSLFLLSSFPISIATLVSIRFTMQQYPAIVESIYFVQAVTSTITGGILLTLMEQAIKEIKKRETKLRTEIKELRIEIDQIKRQKQVAEITTSDFFQDLQQKAATMRKEKKTSLVPPGMRYHNGDSCVPSRLPNTACT